MQKCRIVGLEWGGGWCCGFVGLGDGICRVEVEAGTGTGARLVATIHAKLVFLIYLLMVYFLLTIQYHL